MVDKVHNQSQLVRLQVMFRFLYFLRDLGIVSAKPEATVHWSQYTNILAKIASEGDDVL